MSLSLPLFPVQALELEQLQLQLEAANDLAHRLIRECPKTTCSGLDCAYVLVNGCRTCVCPIGNRAIPPPLPRVPCIHTTPVLGSPARGCDRLPDKFWHELMIDGCPNADDPNGPRTPARKVIRWYRHVRTRFSPPGTSSPSDLFTDRRSQRCLGVSLLHVPILH